MEPLIAFDRLIHQEMLTHPVLFTHPHVKKMALVGDHLEGLSEEASKHAHIQEIWQAKPKVNTSSLNDTRIKIYPEEITSWLKTLEKDSLDLIIFSENEAKLKQEYYPDFFTVLHPEGILIQEAPSFFEISLLKNTMKELRNFGFQDFELLHFPQPGSAFGARSIIAAAKNKLSRKIREADIFNKTFSTRYYNFDVHKAALALPEFMRHEIIL